MGIVYVIRNTKNGFAYVGGSRRPMRRWDQHLWLLRHDRHPSVELQATWNLDKEETFEFVVLERVDDSKLNEREQFWLDFYFDSNKCYNYSRFVNRHSLGQKRTLESRMKMAQSALRRNTSEEKQKAWNEAVSLALKGKPKSESHKAAMRKPKSPEHRQKIAAANRARAAAKAGQTQGAG